VPRGKLSQALREIQRLSGVYNIRVANVFHAGDGNLHPLILFDGREPGALQRAEKLAGEILEMCVKFGGSISGEHGIGVEKLEYLPVMFSENDLDVMQAIYRQVDPLRISNRGKVFIY
jgi:glycolate oxidase